MRPGSSIGHASSLSAWSLLTLGAISFFYSTINKYPIGAMACTILTYFMVIIIQQMAAAEDFVPLFEEIEPYLFTTAMNFWTEGFAREIDWAEVGRQGALLGVYTVVFFTIAQIIFWRRDVTS